MSLASPRTKTTPSAHLLTAALCSASLLAGCTAWDDEVAFPETYKATYTKLHDCRPSAHPAANYIVTWLSPEGSEAWAAMMGGVLGGVEAGEGSLEMPEGAILVKAQYDDEGCSSLSSYTAMEKLAPESDPAHGDWRWQFVDAEGSCNDCDARASCSSCHTGPACGAVFPYVCTQGE